jgi:hypothetical protein
VVLIALDRYYDALKTIMNGAMIEVEIGLIFALVLLQGKSAS